MTYRIEGLSPAQFAPMFDMDDATLGERGAMRVEADLPHGYPCRVSLADAKPGERLILLNHLSHDVIGPYRTVYAIYVREGATAPTPYVDKLPDYLDRRTLSLRGFGADGLLKGAVLVPPGEADTKIRDLFGKGEVATIHAHNAAYGCFLARIERN